MSTLKSSFARQKDTQARILFVTAFDIIQKGRLELSLVDFAPMPANASPNSMTDLPEDLRDAITDARKRFVTTVGALRPRLHRFCARMCGSVLDGEDIVQETLTDAFYNLASL